MRILALILAILFGFAGVIYVTTEKLQDIINHTVCTKDKTVITCHYEDLRL